MFFIENYWVALVFCIITMICWGSWSNMQKASCGKWAFQYLYWDYTIGFLLISLFLALVFGNLGYSNQSFFDHLEEISSFYLLLAAVGGVIFNIGNILIVVAIEMAGLTVAFPIVMGLALVWGVLINYIASPLGNGVYLFSGTALVCAAIVVNAIIYQFSAQNTRKQNSKKGSIVACIAGLFLGSFYFFIALAMTDNFTFPEPGKLNPYSALVVFSSVALIANVLTNTWLMKRPVVGEKLSYRGYFSGKRSLHLYGLFGGVISGFGTGVSFLCSSVVGPAVAYGLAQGATMVAVLWGIFFWKECAGTPYFVHRLILLMMLFYLSGLCLISISKIT